MSHIRIIRIHNELLGTYGDQGNAEVLAFRAKFHGIAATITDVTYEQSIPRNGNIYLLGGAEDAAQLLSLEALARENNLQEALGDGAVLLAVCAGFQIIGQSFWANGSKVDGLGLLDVESNPGGKKRCVGEVKARCSILNLELNGFENHSGTTTLGSSAQAFAKVSSGYGNGDGKNDGAVLGNVFGTYMHGPILARNPQLADLLLTRATARPFSQIEDPLATSYASIARKY
jgi:CobQ-like glutamine amidotransferase family enzyme